MLMKMKAQDSDVIQGLKDTVQGLVVQLQERDLLYKQLFEKYEKCRVTVVDTVSKDDLTHQ
jgi:hypothetical protein